MTSSVGSSDETSPSIIIDDLIVNTIKVLDSIHGVKVENLGDVSLGKLSDGDLLNWNGANWVNAPTLSQGKLDDLTNVSIGELEKGDVLKWEDGWVNSALSTFSSLGGGIGTYKGEFNYDRQFRSLVGGTGISLVEGDAIIINKDPTSFLSLSDTPKSYVNNAIVQVGPSGINFIPLKGTGTATLEVSPTGAISRGPIILSGNPPTKIPSTVNCTIIRAGNTPWTRIGNVVTMAFSIIVKIKNTNDDIQGLNISLPVNRDLAHVDPCALKGSAVYNPLVVDKVFPSVWLTDAGTAVLVVAAKDVQEMRIRMYKKGQSDKQLVVSGTFTYIASSA